MELLAELEALPGVLNAALVYHHVETAARLEEALPDAIDST
jgi:nitrate reductase NapAB chaperone NapD